MATGNFPLEYQWQRSGHDLPGATGATLRIGDVVPGDAGAYSVRVSNGVGTAANEPIVLTVTNFGPMITGPPVRQAFRPGETVSSLWSPRVHARSSAIHGG